MDFGYRGKVAIVTGGGKGIGRAIAEALAAEGADVVIADVAAGEAEAAAGAIAATGLSAHPYRLDVTDAKAVKEAFARIRSERGPVEILVNNAGIVRKNSTQGLSDAEFDAVDRVNFRGALYCCQQVMDGMKERRSGRIVNIVSLVIKMIGRTDVLSYAASKAALGALTKMLAKELGEFGVTVNAVLPGSIALTDFNDSIGYPKDTKLMPGMSIPIGRRGTPEDVAPAVAFLCSKQAGYITGEFLDVNGGLLMD
jgi:NAD(P)-dependent dehydrogenase (short-subunit alcohol dehydrogenase family)